MQKFPWKFSGTAKIISSTGSVGESVCRNKVQDILFYEETKKSKFLTHFSQKKLNNKCF